MMSDSLCKICAEQESKYVCPRCNVLYCSVQCYQSRLHVRCSEEFYKESVFEHMTLDEKSPEDVNKMKKILQRIYDEDQDSETEAIDEESIDSDDELDIAERLKSVSLDDADAVWEKLSASEKQAFTEFLADGCPETVVPIWEPWWMFRKTKPKIEIVGKVSSAEKPCYVSKCPSLKLVPQITELTKKTPSEFIKWNIINVVGSYAYIMRYFNGEPTDFLTEAINLLLSISGNLRENVNYDSYEAAIGDVSHEILQKLWLDGSEAALSTMKDDVGRILYGPEESNASFYLQAALSDIISYLELINCAPKVKGKGQGYQMKDKSSFFKQFQSSTSKDPVPKSKLKLCLRKVEFFLSWVTACPNS